jgi:Tol biopolymer transport system component
MACFGGWLPNGRRLLCSYDDLPGAGVFTIRATDGGDPERQTTYPFTGSCNACDEAIDVAPSGRRFVFLRFKDETINNSQNETVALFVKHFGHGPERQITPYGLAQPHEIADAQWSPDGRRIISSTSDGRLFTVRPNGSGFAQIPLDAGTQDYFAFEPDWSPNGRRIVFGMFIDGQEDLYTANADGTDVRRLTNTPDFENGPDWGR